MNTIPDPQKEPVLDPESMEVFKLLEQARQQYRAYLLTQESLTGNGVKVPSADDYTWDKPLTFAFSG